ncbi:hypothetical protein L1987_02973 [Smallanthus sonchifolius]|uniref:Uncharacterized protein n=1 Tax=Smallanthus sonchifolius TaxID=185202 RepID=A0ACB9K9G9_9ASTR|nr:hypothetical protein L1987_02973 [Smallanthus sonchifolius]
MCTFARSQEVCIKSVYHCYITSRVLTILFVAKIISEVGYNIYLAIITFWSWWWEIQNNQDELARTILTVVVPTLILVWYKWTLSYFRKNTTPLPPRPYGLPVVGYLPFLGHNLHERFTEMAHKYGPIFSLRLGSKLHVVVNSMELVKVVARDLDQTFANSCPPLEVLTITYGGSDMVWSNNNTHWRNMRKLLVSQALSNANLKASQNFRRQEVRKSVKEVYTKIGKSKSGEGEDSSYIGDGFQEVEFKIMELVGAPNISDFIPMLSWFDLQGRRRDMQRQLEFLDCILENIIEDRIKLNSSKMDGELEQDGRKDLLQILLELKDQKDAPILLDIIKIKALLMDIVVAATDTTSTLVEWVMAEILHNPDVMREVEDELTEVIGRRICPGIPLGEKMLVYILASLLHSFEWSLPKDEEFELSDKFGIVTKDTTNSYTISKIIRHKPLYGKEHMLFDLDI